jgi:hypothetical protein
MDACRTSEGICRTDGTLSRPQLDDELSSPARDDTMTSDE